jgi:hypothetical protein
MSPIAELSTMSVTTRPGATALTRIPSPAYSSAADRVSDSAAALDADYTDRPGFGLRIPDTEALSSV